MALLPCNLIWIVIPLFLHSLMKVSVCLLIVSNTYLISPTYHYLTIIAFE